MAKIQKFNEYIPINEKRVISSLEIRDAVNRIISFDDFATDIKFELQNAITKAISPILKKNGYLTDFDRNVSLRRPQAELINFSQVDVTLRFIVPLAVETSIEIISKKQKKTVISDVISPNLKSYEIDLNDFSDRDSVQILLKSEKGNSIINFELNKSKLPPSPLKPKAELSRLSQDDITLNFMTPLAVDTTLEIISSNSKKIVLQDVIKPNTKSYEIDLDGFKDKDIYQILLKSKKGNDTLNFYLDKTTLPEQDEVYSMHPAIG